VGQREKTVGKAHVQGKGPKVRKNYTIGPWEKKTWRKRKRSPPGKKPSPGQERKSVGKRVGDAVLSKEKKKPSV